MTLTTDLSASFLKTYTALFHDPISPGLGWSDVHALLRELGEVQTKPNGSLNVTRNGHSLVLRLPLTTDVDSPEEIMALRKFIEDSESLLPAIGVGPDVDIHGHLIDHASPRLLVIDHQEARLFRTELKDGAPQCLLSHEPSEYFRHAKNSRGFSRAEETNGFFEPVAKALQGTGDILIFGTGTGTSNEMEQFVKWVKDHHPKVSNRIIGEVVVDKQHLTDAQLLAKARACYQNHADKKR